MTLAISVLIPTYNRAHLIPKALDSVLQQDFRPLEVLVVDDGSTDDTPRLASSWPPLVRYIQKANGGVSSARNLGIREAKGDWIAFLDSDDWWEPGKLRAQVQALAAQPDARFCYTGGWNVWSDGRRVQYGLATPDRLWPAFWYANQVNGSSILAHRQTLLDAGLFDESMRTCEDWDFWVRLNRRVPFVAVPEPYVHTLQQPNSLSMDTARLLADSQIIANKLLNTLPPGPERMYRQRTMRAVQLYHAAIIEREHGRAFHVQYLIRSLLSMPLPSFMPVRYRALLVGLVRILQGKLR